MLVALFVRFLCVLFAVCVCVFVFVCTVCLLVLVGWWVDVGWLRCVGILHISGFVLSTSLQSFRTSRLFEHAPTPSVARAVMSMYRNSMS